MDYKRSLRFTTHYWGLQEITIRYTLGGSAGADT